MVIKKKTAQNLSLVIFCKDWNSVIDLSLDLAVLSAKTEHKFIHEITKLNDKMQVILHSLDIIFSFAWKYLAILNAALVRIDEILIANTNITY